MSAVLLPAYFYPSGNAWTPLFNAIDSNPSSFFQVIVNPSSGPGSSAQPEKAYQTAIRSINQKANTRTYGYVHVSWTQRPMADVKKDIDTYAGWRSDDANFYNMRGIFFDEAPSKDDPAQIAYMREVNDYARQAIGNNSRVMYNPGTPVESDEYYTNTNWIVAYENTYGAATNFADDANYPLSKVNPKFRQNIVREFPNDSKLQDSLVEKLSAAGVGSVSITTLGDYDGFGAIYDGLAKVSGKMNVAMTQPKRRGLEWSA